MNIFVLDNDPAVAAQMLCDKHVPKMIVESGQMLSTVHRVLDGALTRKPSKSGKTMVKYWDLFEGADDLEAEQLFYKAVHVGHPCTVWTTLSSANYDWHWQHFNEMCDEYQYRFGKVHLTDKLLRHPLRSQPRNIKQGPMTPFAQAMTAYPDCMTDDAVQAYRNYYHAAKPFAKWERGRPAPSWWLGYQNAA